MPSAFQGGAPAAVSATGQVVGTYNECPGGHSHEAFSWTQKGGLVLLGNLAGSDCCGSFANAVNDSGEVVGNSGPWAPARAFSWTQAGGLVDLGLGGAEAINDSGQVVGDAATSTGSDHAALWNTRR
jgi:probable HAF family extracellular repeat protein